MKAKGFSQLLFAGFALMTVLSALRPPAGIAAESPIPAPPINLAPDRGPGLTPEQRQERLERRIAELEQKAKKSPTEIQELTRLKAIKTNSPRLSSPPVQDLRRPNPQQRMEWVENHVKELEAKTNRSPAEISELQRLKMSSLTPVQRKAWIENRIKELEEKTDLLPAEKVELRRWKMMTATPAQRQELIAGRIKELELKSNLTATEQSELRSLRASQRAISPVPQSTPGVSAPKPQK